MHKQSLTVGVFAGGLGDDPVTVVADTGVDTRVGGFTAAVAPADDTHLDSLTGVGGVLSEQRACQWGVCV